MTVIPVCIILLARRARIPRIEWLIISLIVLIFCSFFLFLGESLIYPLVVYGIGFIIAYFSFEKQNFTNDKFVFKAHANENDSFIFGELPPSISQNRTDVSMRFYRDEQYFGTAVPVAKHGYNFTFYEKGVKCCNLYNSINKWDFPFIYKKKSYCLEENNINLLIIRDIYWRKINIEFYNGDSLIIPLYKRNMELFSKYGVRIKFGLYPEGIIIKYDRLEDEQMMTSISCSIYFLWLIIFGTNRTDY